MTEPSGNQASQFWRLSADALARQLGCGLQELATHDATERLSRFGPNSDALPRIEGAMRAIVRRLFEPLSLILLVAGIISMLTGDDIGGLIIVLILTLSIGLDTIQEGHAVRAAEILRRSVALKAEVKRDGAFCQIDVEQVVPGDILRIRAGDIIPADALIIDSTALLFAVALAVGLTPELLPMITTVTLSRGAWPAAR